MNLISWFYATHDLQVPMAISPLSFWPNDYSEICGQSEFNNIFSSAKIDDGINVDSNWTKKKKKNAPGGKNQSRFFSLSPLAEKWSPVTFFPDWRSLEAAQLGPWNFYDIYFQISMILWSRNPLARNRLSPKYAGGGFGEKFGDDFLTFISRRI